MTNMTTAERMATILVFARHLVSDQSVQLHVQSATALRPENAWMVHVDHQGFTMWSSVHDKLDDALDELLRNLHKRVHTKMEEATKLLRDTE